MSRTHVQPADTADKPDQKLLEAIVRPRAWLADLQTGRFSSIEELATSANLHPKVVRQALRLAFLSPDITTAILTGDPSTNLKLAAIPKLLPLDWAVHRQMLRPLWW
jgi:site-specific DNA recombinase